MSDDESVTQNTMICPFCEGNGEVDTVEQLEVENEVERSVSWALDVRKRVLEEIKEMKITQDVFACASLGNRQSHLNQILRQALSQRPEKHRTEEMLQIDTFLRLPLRCRKDIYEYVTEDPSLFVRLARFHARLLQEDAGLPGLSQISRAVLDRFASEVTLYPNPRQVEVLAESLNLQPDLVRTYFNHLSLKLTSSSHCRNVQVAEFKVPYARVRPERSSTHIQPQFKIPMATRCPVANKRRRIDISDSTIPQRKVVKVEIPKEEDVPPGGDALPKTNNVGFQATARLRLVDLDTCSVGSNEAAEVHDAPEMEDCTTVAMNSQIHGTPGVDNSIHIKNGEASDEAGPAAVNEWAWPSLSSSPKLERPPDGLETDDSFVRGLLASPESRHSSSPPTEESVYCETLSTPVRPEEPIGY